MYEGEITSRDADQSPCCFLLCRVP